MRVAEIRDTDGDTRIVLLETGAPLLAEDAVVAAAAMSEDQIAEEIAQSLSRR